MEQFCEVSSPLQPSVLQPGDDLYLVAPVFAPQNLARTLQREMWRDTLVAYVVDDRIFEPEALQAAMATHWLLAGPVEVRRVSEHIFYWSCADKRDREDLLRCGPLNVDGALILIRAWEANAFIDLRWFGPLEVWVSMKGAPAEYVDETLARGLGALAGEVLDVDPGNIDGSKIDFARALVRLDVAEPLLPSAILLLDNGEQVEMRYAYDRLFHICYRCGRVGHSEGVCIFTRVEAMASFQEKLDRVARDHGLVLAVADPRKVPFTRGLRGEYNSPFNRTTCIEIKWFSARASVECVHCLYGTRKVVLGREGPPPVASTTPATQLSAAEDLFAGVEARARESEAAFARRLFRDGEPATAPPPVANGVAREGAQDGLPALVSQDQGQGGDSTRVGGHRVSSASGSVVRDSDGNVLSHGSMGTPHPLRSMSIVKARVSEKAHEANQ